MAHQTSEMSMRYAPPKLPTYLASTFDLKPIVGVPTDDEVKAIHAVIRAVDTASQIPEWCDPGLSMELAQHLFDVQMARYKDKYPVSVFPTNQTYTPPTLPSHIKVPLEAITGAPSDDEVKLVHTALRSSENLVNLPSVFDPHLSMSLSQHLFDIQFARYIRRTTEGYYTARDTSSGAEPNPQVSTARLRVPIDSASDTEPETTPEAAQSQPITSPNREYGSAPQAFLADASAARSRTITLSEDACGIIEQLRANQAQADHSLKDVLENVTRIMIKLHNHSARGFNSGNDYKYHHIVDENGEAPTVAMSYIYGCNQNFWNNTPGSTLAQYLKFYHTGLDLIDEEDTTTVKPGSEGEARIILGKHTHARTP